MSTLRQVLEVFKDTSYPLSVTQIAHELDMDKGVLEDMIVFWVRKGKLRDASQCTDSCCGCGCEDSCPFVVNMPKSYTIVQDG